MDQNQANIDPLEHEQRYANDKWVWYTAVMVMSWKSTSPDFTKDITQDTNNNFTFILFHGYLFLIFFEK